MKKMLLAVVGMALASVSALADDMFQVKSATGVDKGNYGSFSEAWAVCEDFGTLVVLQADAGDIAVSGRHLTLAVSSGVSYTGNITVGDRAELSFDGRSQGSLGGTLTINGTNTEVFIDGGTIAKLVLSKGYALVNDATVTAIEATGGSLQVEYSKVASLTASNCSLTRGFENTITTQNIDASVTIDDYVWTEDTTSSAVRMRLDGGNWTAYKTFVLAVTAMGKATTATKVEIELLRNATMGTKSKKCNFATSGFQHAVDITIRSNSEGTKRYVLQRGNIADSFSDNPGSTTYKHTLRFENVVLDGGAKWTNPFHFDSDSDVLRVHTGITNAKKPSSGTAPNPFIVCTSGANLILGDNSEIRNIQTFHAIYADSGVAYELTFAPSFRMTSNRTAGYSTTSEPKTGHIIDMRSSSSATVKVLGGRFDRNYSFRGSLFKIDNSTITSDSVFFENCKITRNQTYGQNMYLLYPIAHFVLKDVDITHNESGYANIPAIIYDDSSSCVTFSGHPIIRNNFTSEKKAAGLWLAGSTLVSDVLDWGAYVEVPNSSISLNYADGASGFDHIVLPDKTKVAVTTSTSGKLSWGTPSLFSSVGEIKSSGAISAGMLKFQLDGNLNAGTCTLSGALTFGSSAIASIGAPYELIANWKGKQKHIPLLTATSISGTLPSLALPEGWHLATFDAAQNRQELRLVYNPTGGLVIFAKP